MIGIRGAKSLYAKVSIIFCTSVAPESEEADDLNIDLILRRATKVLENLTVVSPVCLMVQSVEVLICEYHYFMCVFNPFT